MEIREAFEPIPPIEATDIKNTEKGVEKGPMYDMFLKSAAELFMLAGEHHIITKEGFDVFVRDFKLSRSMLELKREQDILISLLYRKGVDFSDILFKNHIVDEVSYLSLKADISRGTEFTNKDADDKKELEKINAEVSAGIETRSSADEKAAKIRKGMAERKNAFPQK